MAVLNLKIREQHALLRQLLYESSYNLIPQCALTLTRTSFEYEGKAYDIVELGDDRLSHIKVRENGKNVELTGGELFRYLRELRRRIGNEIIRHQANAWCEELLNEKY